MDAAERLFAEQGIATVSDRQIADAAGNSNHSAVGYYFGGRPGLVSALLKRHHDAVEPTQRRMFAQSASVLGDVRALVIPLTDALGALPHPSWRARFLDQALHDPGTIELMRAGAATSDTAARAILASIAERLAHLDRTVIEGRGRLTAHLMSTACAEIEQGAEDTGVPARWSEVGDFLCDAVAGMLEAPITRSTSG